ncbi:Uncharacterized protein TCAP_06266 [Tolypocladium capitatum]|uniref:Uncharacterized protein n=1 Tax=Tolypocladium capitatum TaxID=45235 RepID=A0A2K3Q899_9HYPO|nr:Uncharacterized protein TCAP_06266 [Tolypocladium capitatum]
MGVVGAAIKFIAIPIVLVILIALVVFLLIRSRRKRSKDIEESENLPPFSFVPPPSYNGLPAKPPAAAVHNSYPVG